MEKPVTIRRKEMIEKVCSAINESGLPAFAIRDALRLIDQDLVRAQEEELKRDTQAWPCNPCVSLYHDSYQSCSTIV